MLIAEFQKRVLQLLCELNVSIKQMGQRTEMEDTIYDVPKITTTEELLNVENDMKNQSKRLALVRGCFVCLFVA